MNESVLSLGGTNMYFIRTNAFIGSTHELVSVRGRSCCPSDEDGDWLRLVATKSSCGELAQSVMGGGRRVSTVEGIRREERKVEEGRVGKGTQVERERESRS
jgi:hypothetical protein